MKDERVRYYQSDSDDFFQTGETYHLSDDYRWIRKDFGSRFLSGLIYGLALIFSSVYCRLFLHVRIVGAGKLRRQKGGFFLYGNHTQPVGDVFDPALACFPKRIYTVVSAANLFLPVIGRLLPYLGALPIPSSFHGMKEFTSAIEHRIRSGHPVVIYPEAHLWEYYTQIRPFSDTSFKYAVGLGVPSYSMTTTYQKRKFGKKPRITVYVDGPFAVEGANKRQAAALLRDQIFSQMQERAKSSSYAYITYLRKQ